jgi:hypothetical protein
MRGTSNCDRPSNAALELHLTANLSPRFHSISPKLCPPHMRKTTRSRYGSFSPPLCSPSCRNCLPKDMDGASRGVVRCSSSIALTESLSPAECAHSWMKLPPWREHSSVCAAEEADSLKWSQPPEAAVVAFAGNTKSLYHAREKLWC